MSHKIHRYNQFLLHLDQQYWKTKDPVSTSKEKELEDYLKEIEKSYQSYYNNDNQRPEKEKSLYFPDLYNEKEDEIAEKREKYNALLHSSRNRSLSSSIPLVLPFDKRTLSEGLKTPREREREEKVILIPEKEQKQEKGEKEEKKEINVVCDKEIETINDLLQILTKYPLDNQVKYNVNLQGLHSIHDELTQLNAIIGMQTLKKSLVEQLLYFIQEFYKKPDSSNVSLDKNQDYLHTVISGPPGTGKTEIAQIIGKIYSKIGILSKGTFKKVTRSDLIAGYLGQTAIKTKDVIRDSLGGVLFIDEAYALGNSEKRDSFSKECIDTLCEALSDHKDHWMVIIAGYEDEIRECFFSYNQGLESRFTWRFQTEKYGAEDLYQIFLKKVKDSGWSILSDSSSLINVSWFEKNKDYFPSYGRDIETFLSRVKIAHSKRVFGKDEKERCLISYQDMEKGFAMFLKNTDEKKREEEKERKRICASMYL
jgi:hypothetical protein